MATGTSHAAQPSKASPRAPRLTIGSHQDAHEHEADRAVAALSGPGTAPPSLSAPVSGSEIAPPSVGHALEGSGRSLDVTTRAEMESHFGHDFSRVRVHTGDAAARSAADVHASAYTVGNDIVLGGRAPAQGSGAGRHLMAHELAHVVQQSRLPPSNHLVQRQWLVPPPQAGGFNRGFDQDKQYLLHPTPEEIERRRKALERERALSAALKPFKDAILGEWEDDPSTAGMLLDTGLGLIPIVDQGLDLRDIIAHIFMLSEKREYDKPMRWVGLVLTLIGVVPEIGSAVKGVAKIAIKKGAKALPPLIEALSKVAKVSGDIPELVSRFRKQMASNWSSWVSTGKAAFYKCIAMVEGFLDSVGSSEKLAMVRKIRELAAEKLDEAFAALRREIDEALEALSPSPAMAGGPSHVPRLPDGGSVGPKVKGKKKPRVVDPSHPSGSRSTPSRPKGEDLPRRLDLEDLPRRAGETGRQALARTKRFVGQKLKDLPGLAAEWDEARKAVLKRIPKPTNEKEARAAFDAVREEFWSRVQKNKTLEANLKDAGFEFPGKGRAPQLAGVDPAIPDAEKTISLDHLTEIREDFSKALDAKNLKLEMSAPNTMREIVQMRHPELKP